MTFRDDTGRVIKIAGPSERIVSLAPNMTEILFAVGAGNRVVGVSNFCDYPAEARRLPKVGGVQIEVENVLKLHPDLVVGDARLQPAVIAQLRSAGLQVIAFSPDRWSRVLSTIRRMGQIAGRRRAAETVVQRMEARRLRVAHEIQGRKRVRVFVEIWNKPLMTAGSGTFIHELIGMAGGEDIAGDQKQSWSVIPAELVIARNPQVIVLTCKDRNEVLSRPGWDGLDAVRDGRVYEVDPDIYSRPGPRLADALEDLSDLLSGKERGRL